MIKGTEKHCTEELLPAREENFLPARQALKDESEEVRRAESAVISSLEQFEQEYSF